jgi:cell division protein FtsL
MFDLIEKKIESIRQKPDNIRMRYVWLWVAITTSLIVFIWLLSLQITFYNLNIDNSQNTESQNTDIQDLKTEIEQIKNQPNQQSTSINDLLIEQ